MTLGQRIGDIRERLGSAVRELSYRDFASLIEQRTGVAIAFASLSRWEKNEGEPTLAQLQAIAAVDPLKRGPVWLAGWEGRAVANGHHVDKIAESTPQGGHRLPPTMPAPPLQDPAVLRRRKRR
jgi:transcriptional regulator with XRE-family HTH domain